MGCRGRTVSQQFCYFNALDSQRPDLHVTGLSRRDQAKYRVPLSCEREKKTVEKSLPVLILKKDGAAFDIPDDMMQKADKVYAGVKRHGKGIVEDVEN